MQRLVILALIILAACALAGPRLTAVSAPGVSMLRTVQQLLACDAGVLHRVSADHTADGAGQCAAIAGTLAAPRR